MDSEGPSREQALNKSLGFKGFRVLALGFQGFRVLGLQGFRVSGFQVPGS